MSTEYIKWHKHEELERIAKDIHKKYKCEIPIDIDFLIEIMGLDIRDISRLKEDFGLYGFIGKVRDTFTIFVQKGDFKITNYNTNLTLAEELSHYILHKHYFETVNDIDEAFDFYAHMKKEADMMMEFNAKHLAGALLIPLDDLKIKALALFKENKEILSRLLKNDCDQIINYLSIVLSDIYRAPQAAIIYRLKAKVVGFKEILKDECNFLP
jgi:Zn-dependent peptidase ImmA (M78 family)